MPDQLWPNPSKCRFFNIAIPEITCCAKQSGQRGDEPLRNNERVHLAGERSDLHDGYSLQQFAESRVALRPLQPRTNVVVVAKVLLTLPRPGAIPAWLAGVLLQKSYKLLGSPHHQRAQHQGIDEAEDRGIGPDAESQR